MAYLRCMVLTVCLAFVFCPLKISAQEREVIRPLSDFSEAEIQMFVKQLGAAYSKDEISDCFIAHNILTSDANDELLSTKADSEELMKSAMSLATLAETWRRALVSKTPNWKSNRQIQGPLSELINKGAKAEGIYKAVDVLAVSCAEKTKIHADKVSSLLVEGAVQ